MKITILNASPQPAAFDDYLRELQTILAARGHQVTQLDLRDLRLRYCIGCFGCWVKTPGECASQDASLHIGRAVIHSDFTLWAAPLQMGFPSALLKMALDKSIPLIHPYMLVDQGEAHHRPRYHRYPRIGLLLEREADTDAADLEIVSNVLARSALNFKSRLDFALTSESPAAQVAHRIMAQNGAAPIKPPKGLPALPGKRIDPPGRVTIFNGSPRGRKGNTPILLAQFGQGFAALPGHQYEIHHLNRVNDIDQQVRAFESAECVWVGFPLYTDAMPGMVKAFIERLAHLPGRSDNPPIGFLVQSGFPEALHSRYIERYLHKLAARLGSTYLGTIVKGGGEGVRLMPPEANENLFTTLQALGRGFAENGQLDPELLPVVAGVERYPAYMGAFFKVFLRLPAAKLYWDSQLKENGAYGKRNARPFLEKLQ